jgi:tRNA threonylcarbamoyladenosine biosynthesis protein TsaE
MAPDPTVRHWYLPGPDATERLGSALASACPWDAPGPRLAYLSGPLGSGKTTLVAALLHALGVRDPVRSPSYALLEPYPLVQGLAVHVDCYRLGGAPDLEALGLRDYFADHHLLLIEWPEQAGGALPPPDLALQLTVEGAGRACRAVAHTPTGARWLAHVGQPETSVLN